MTLAQCSIKTLPCTKPAHNSPSPAACHSRDMEHKKPFYATRSIITQDDWLTINRAQNYYVQAHTVSIITASVQLSLSVFLAFPWCETRGLGGSGLFDEHDKILLHFSYELDGSKIHTEDYSRGSPGFPTVLVAQRFVAGSLKFSGDHQAWYPLYPPVLVVMIRLEF
jgi:hypothetical protein